MRPTSITSAPSDANRCAVAWPMPWPAPVTITPLPSKRRIVPSYPLSAPAVRPRMKKRWPTRYSTSIGTDASSMPAISTGTSSE